MNTRNNYQQPDLDSIEELNYISTEEEDAVIDAHIEKLREWGYGTIAHVNDLHQLFWEITRRGIVCDKLFRVAVVECIDEESLFTKFLGMAKRFNGWSMKLDQQDAKEKKELSKKLAEKQEKIKELKECLIIANANIDKLAKERQIISKTQKEKSPSAIENELRAQLKKEYGRKLLEFRRQVKKPRLTAKAFMSSLMNPCSRFFEAFDFTKEKDVDDYIYWFRMAGRKINMPTQKIIIDQYGEDAIPYFIKQVEEYNTLWEQSHSEEDESEDESDD